MLIKTEIVFILKVFSKGKFTKNIPGAMLINYSSYEKNRREAPSEKNRQNVFLCRSDYNLREGVMALPPESAGKIQIPRQGGVTVPPPPPAGAQKSRGYSA